MSCSRSFFICYLLVLKSDFNRKEQKRQKLSKNYHLIIHNSATENSGTLREFKNMWAEEKINFNIFYRSKRNKETKTTVTCSQSKNGNTKT